MSDCFIAQNVPSKNSSTIKIILRFPVSPAELFPAEGAELSPSEMIISCSLRVSRSADLKESTEILLESGTKAFMIRKRAERAF